MSSPKKPSRKPLAGFSIDAIPASASRFYVPEPSREKFKTEAEYEAAKIAYLVESQLTKVMDDGRVPENVDMARVVNLRFSGLPFCNVRWFINLKNSLGTERPTDFGYRYFTRVGHAVHDVFQTAVEKEGKIEFLKDYVCTQCKKRYVLRAQQPFKCTCGSFMFKSEEHEVRWKGALGHVDEVIRPYTNRKKSIFIWDYKTTSLNNLNKKDPIGYVTQIRSYAVAMEDAGYEVLGMGLVYIPRDNPFKKRMSVVEWTPKIQKSHRVWMDYWVESHAEGTQVKSLDQATRLLDDRPCKTKQPAVYVGCEFTDFCAGNCQDRPKEMVERITGTYKRVSIWLPLKRHKRQ